MNTNSREIAKQFKKIKELVTTAKNFKELGYENAVLLEKANEELLLELCEKLEALSVAEGVSTKCKTNMILEGGVWYPVDLCEENTQGGLIWSIQHPDGPVDNGTSRFGQFANIDEEGRPWIGIDIDDLDNQEMHFI